MNVNLHCMEIYQPVSNIMEFKSNQVQGAVIREQPLRGDVFFNYRSD